MGMTIDESIEVIKHEKPEKPYIIDVDIEEVVKALTEAKA